MDLAIRVEIAADVTMTIFKNRENSIGNKVYRVQLLLICFSNSLMEGNILRSLMRLR